MKLDACRWLENPTKFSQHKHAVLLGSHKEFAILSQIRTIWARLQPVELTSLTDTEWPWQSPETRHTPIQQLDLFGQPPKPDQPKVLEILIDPQRFNPTQQKQSLDWLISNPPPDTIVLFRILSYQPALLKTTWFKYLEQNHVVITCWSLSAAHIPDYIRYTLKQDYPNLEIPTHALQQFAQQCQIYFSPLAVQQFSRLIGPCVNPSEPISTAQWATWQDYFQTLLTQQADLISPEHWIEAIFKSQLSHMTPYFNYLVRIQRTELTLLLFLLHQMILHIHAYQKNTQSDCLKTCSYKQKQLLAQYAHSFSSTFLETWIQNWDNLDRQFKYLDPHTPSSSPYHHQLLLQHIALSLATRKFLSIRLFNTL